MRTSRTSASEVWQERILQAAVEQQQGPVGACSDPNTHKRGKRGNRVRGMCCMCVVVVSSRWPSHFVRIAPCVQEETVLALPRVSLVMCGVGSSDQENLNSRSPSLSRILRASEAYLTTF